VHSRHGRRPEVAGDAVRLAVLESCLDALT